MKISDAMGGAQPDDAQEERDEASVLDQINKKLDLIMRKLGIEE